jgi:hypothetical protein
MITFAMAELDESINEMMHRHRSRQVNGEPSGELRPRSVELQHV